MAGEDQMTGMIVELLTNLFQGIMFSGFLYFYFEKPEKKILRVLPFFGSATALFSICSFFTLSRMHTGIDSFFMDSILCIGAMLTYSLVFLKGKLYLRARNHRFYNNSHTLYGDFIQLHFCFSPFDYNDNILVYLLIICISMILVTVLTMLLLSRISKVNNVKTQLMLITQREKLYEQSTLATNSRIEKISSIKHDIRNKIGTLEKLIEEKNYDDALALCKETSLNLDSQYTPIHAHNPILNAIVNDELEKAASADIDFSVDIRHTLDFLSSSDTASLRGNLCDNAIEYLLTQPKENRRMALKIHTHLNFCIVTCQNRTDGNVLKSNPNLTTLKPDKDSHGKGISILNRIAKYFDGDLVIKEEDGYLCVSTILKTK